ncbi:MAG TPA: TIR domain-containing protein [Longimicrobium sp.]|nr:TIR domain-containing protein [Longimicrobium sp.]
MRRHIFISYRFKDRNIAHNVETFFQTQGGTCDGKPKYVEQNLSSEDSGVIEAEIRRVMDQCMGVLLVVGDDNHNSTWIDYEVAHADGSRLPIVAVRLPGYTGGVPQRVQNRVRAQEIPFVAWEQTALCTALNKMEGMRSSIRSTA